MSLKHNFNTNYPTSNQDENSSSSLLPTKFKKRPGPNIRGIVRTLKSVEKCDNGRSEDQKKNQSSDRNEIEKEDGEEIHVIESVAESLMQRNEGVLTSFEVITDDRTASRKEVSPSVLLIKFEKKPRPNIRGIVRAQTIVEQCDNDVSSKGDSETNDKRETEEVSSIDAVIKHIREVSEKLLTSPEAITDKTTPRQDSPSLVPTKFKKRPGPNIRQVVRNIKNVEKGDGIVRSSQDVERDYENLLNDKNLLENRDVGEVNETDSKRSKHVQEQISTPSEVFTDNKDTCSEEGPSSLLLTKFKKRPGPNIRQVVRTLKSIEESVASDICSHKDSETKNDNHSNDTKIIEGVSVIDSATKCAEGSNKKVIIKEESIVTECNGSPVVLISETTPVFLEEDVKIIETSVEITGDYCDKPSVTEENETSVSLIVLDNSSGESRSVDSPTPGGKTSEVEVQNGKVNKSKTLNTGPRLTVKPKLTAIDKLKRPSKFTTSTYGKMSFEVRQSMQKKFGNGTPDLAKMTMMDLIFYNPDSNPMTFSTKCENLGDLNSEDAEQEKQKVDNNQVLSENDDAMPVPKLTLSADGKVVVAQESLKVKQTKSFIVDSTLSNAKKTKKIPDRQAWSFEDTVKFYKALKTIGSDFEMMKSIFPDRSRKCLKSKFKREERLNGCLIDKVMTRHSEYDLQSLEKELEEVKEFKEIARKINKGGRRRKKGGSGPSTRIKCAFPLLPEDKDSAKKRPQMNGKRKQVLSDDEEESAPSKVLKTSTKPIMKVRPLEEPEESEEEENVCRIVVRKNRKKSRVFSQRHLDMVQSMLNSDGLMTISPPQAVGTPRICFRRKVGNTSLGKKGMKKEKCVPGNRIVINTNIDFDNVKYTKSVSYDPNNLENPLDINETIAH